MSYQVKVMHTQLIELLEHVHRETADRLRCDGLIVTGVVGVVVSVGSGVDVVVVVVAVLCCWC